MSFCFSCLIEHCLKIRVSPQRSACTQKKDAVIRNFDASADKCINDEVSEKVVNKPSTLEQRRMQLEVRKLCLL